MNSSLRRHYGWIQSTTLAFSGLAAKAHCTVWRCNFSAKLLGQVIFAPLQVRSCRNQVPEAGLGPSVPRGGSSRLGSQSGGEH